jgi:uncharacterized protein
MVGCLLVISQGFSQATLSGTSYIQNFNDLATDLPDGWTVRVGATASSLGTEQLYSKTTVTWGDTSKGFRNVASTSGLNSSSSTLAQHGSSDRALGVRQASDFGDPGAAFVFNFNSTGLNLNSLSFDALMLSVQTRSTTWTIDYGIGATPTSFTSLGTYSDPGVWGSTPFSVSGSVLDALSNQASVWIRIVALVASTGSGSRDTFAIDNFTLSYGAISGAPIPEPSTYAAIFGALALGGVMWHRRRKAKLAA